MRTIAQLALAVPGFELSETRLVAVDVTTCDELYGATVASAGDVNDAVYLGSARASTRPASSS
jgi:hypothetical protein